MNALPQLVPNSVAEYHLSRARCQKREKRARRADKRSVEKRGDLAHEHSGDVAQPELRSGDDNSRAEAVGEKRKDPPSPSVIPTRKLKPIMGESHNSRPERPQIMDHLVLGINETIKSLERSIDDLKLRLLILADALNAISRPRPNNLLPTAPRSPSSSPTSSPEPNTLAKSSAHSALVFILIPLQSISPQTLVSPIPQYCATFNSLVYQYLQLAKVASNRLKGSAWDNSPVEEVRVVPMGRTEVELAAMVGLRRLACFGLRVRAVDI